MSILSIRFRIGFFQFAVIMILCTTLIGLNIWLFKQNQSLKAIVRKTTTQSEITFGLKILPYAGIDKTGEEVQINLSGEQKTILLIYSSTCRFCESNAVNWEKMVNAADKNLFRIIAVSVFNKDAHLFVERNHFMNDVFVISQNPNSQTNVKFARTPQTILLNKFGEVEKIWDGELNQKSLQEINEDLKINLTDS